MNQEIEAPKAVPRPLAVIDNDNGPFWEAARRGELQMQRCSACGHIRYPVAPVCPECLSEELSWVKLSGRGVVFSSIVFHQVYHMAFAKEVPYNVSLIQLEEGPRMFSNVVGLPPSEVRVGDQVKVVFETLAEDFALPRFRLREAAASSDVRSEA